MLREQTPSLLETFATAKPLSVNCLTASALSTSVNYLLAINTSVYETLIGTFLSFAEHSNHRL